jgi:hypothetical protein
VEQIDSSFFVENDCTGWDGHIYMRNVKQSGDKRQLTCALPCGTGKVPIGFIWDGSSSPPGFRWLFPRHNHPIASCRHDWRCRNAKNAKERKFADAEFKKDVGRTSCKITATVGYIGVRAGAMLGIGVHY